ncbi:hypothetical protein [Clostridium gasigenes]|uniref:YhfM-like domain-containing protein n=1 Tax=Clostridium gasigenes TaxID=94869 RepID=A0A7X0SDZ2_9CLOT|nr:hypothetical protein [Clostridium gasigenes]MBB6715774.1 hypothetical protein [Clostridium gasigenes]
MKKTKKAVAVVATILISLNFVGCNTIDNLQKKLGFKNEYFEKFQTQNIDQISIQSVRDPAFKFIVTESKAIEDMYKLLYSSKESENKTELSPDYIFEFNMGDKVEKFNYIVGAHEGNFYNDTNIFTVSSRVDEGIMKNLSFIRKPRDFEYIYYNSISNILNLKKKEFTETPHKVGIDIQGDVDCLKYVFSTDIEAFLKKARKTIPDIELVNNNASEFDVVLTVKNKGYDSSTYKSKISVDNKKDKIQEDYYIKAKNEFREWNIVTSEANISKPNEWYEEE